MSIEFLLISYSWLLTPDSALCDNRSAPPEGGERATEKVVGDRPRRVWEPTL